jgi:hypothetical protein
MNDFFMHQYVSRVPGLAGNLKRNVCFERGENEKYPGHPICHLTAALRGLFSGTIRLIKDRILLQ